MLFTISKTSDQFMDCDLPSPNVCPFGGATWNNTYGDWTVDISIEDLVKLMDGRGTRLIVRRIGSWLPHIEIDNVSVK